MHRLRFFKGYDQFNPVLARKYNELQTYLAEYNRPVKDTDAIVSYLDKVFEFQKLVKRDPDPATIAQTAKLWFNPADGVEIDDACAVDMKYYNMMQELLDYAEPVHVLLNEIPVLTEGSDISPELDQEIRTYLSAKSVEI
jgi:hypothetical protein